MVHPGSFKGIHKEFLEQQKPAYADAVIGSYVNDCIADICRRYFKRFLVDLDHDVDPSPEWLAAVDDDKADPEIPGPCEEQMTAEEYGAALREWDKQKTLIGFRKMVSLSAVCHQRQIPLC
jgi:hypothetical protein